MLVHFVLDLTHAPVKPCGMVGYQGAFPGTLLPPSKNFLRDRSGSRTWGRVRGNLGNTRELRVQSSFRPRPAIDSPSGSLVAILFYSGLSIPFSLAFRCPDKLVLFQTCCFLSPGRVALCSPRIKFFHFITQPVVCWQFYWHFSCTTRVFTLPRVVRAVIRVTYSSFKIWWDQPRKDRTDRTVSL